MIAVGVSVKKKVQATTSVKDRLSAAVSIAGRIVDMAHDSIEKIYTAGENISSGNVVMLSAGQVFKYDPSTEANYGKAIGIAKTAALTGEIITVILSGSVNITGWGLVQDATYYAVAAGAVSSSPPSSGLIGMIGVAKDTNTMIIDIDEPIVLN